MLIYSELKSAQLENNAGNPTPASTGRVYIDTTAPTAALPKVYDGSAWRNFYDPFTVYDNGNSGSSKTIDWSNGLTQKVALSGNCQFTFTNGQTGRAHTLIIIQNATVPYFYRLPSDINWKRQNVIQPLIAPNNLAELKFIYSPNVMAAKLSLGTSYPNPVALPAGTVNQLAVSPSGRFVLIADNSSPFTYIYQLIDTPAGPVLGARAANPGTLPTGVGRGCAWAPGEDFVAVAHTTSPFVSVYPFFATTLAYGAKITNPGSLPAGNGTSVAFTPLGDAIVVGCATTPFVASYPFSAGAFGAIHGAPGTTPAGTVTGIDFKPQHANTFSTDTYIALGMAVSPYIAIYAYTAAAGFGAKSTDPSSLPAGVAGTGHCVAFHPSGNFVAIATQTNPYVQVWPVSSAGVFGTIVPDPATPPAGAGNGLAWTPDGDFLVVAHGTSPFNSWYPFNTAAGGSFGTRLTDSATLPPAAANDVAIAPNGGAVIFGSGTTPFQTMYNGVRNAQNYIGTVM